MTSLAGLDAGEAVTAEQMFNLFGLGLHPLADDLEAQYNARTDARVAAGAADPVWWLCQSMPTAARTGRVLPQAL